MTASSNPEIEAYRLMCAGRLTEALTFAERAVAGKGCAYRPMACSRRYCCRLGRASRSGAVVLRALECEPGIADAFDGLAHVSLLLGQHQRSNALYRRVVELSPDTARFWYNLASSERSFGRLAEAEAACDRAIALDSAQYATYLLRSELRVQTRRRITSRNCARCSRVRESTIGRECLGIRTRQGTRRPEALR